LLRAWTVATMKFRDRHHAGKFLAEQLKPRFADRPDTVVFGLPRGGVPVAFEVARALHLPLDVFIVRKLGVPGYEELAMGAIASGGTIVLNQSLVDALAVPPGIIREVTETETRELLRRERQYRDGYPPPEVRHCTVILVDDGLATGATMRAAATALRQKEPERIVVAVPVASREACAELRQEVDEMVCAQTPEPFYGVGFWYEDFSQTGDGEVHTLLAQARERYTRERHAPRLAKAA
jgi:putative phosphoribosyl transferase